MSKRQDQIKAFLNETPWAGTSVQALAADASFRMYHRVCGGPKPAVLMDAPPDKEDTRPFARIADHLIGLGYRAPYIFARDFETGFLLLEDLGDATLTKCLADGADEQRLYQRAIDLLIDLHRRPSAETIPTDLAPYDADTLLKETLLFPDWYLPQITGTPTTAVSRTAYIDAWKAVLPLAEPVKATIVLRDYHVDNIMDLGGPSDIRSMGLLDFQDALAGHPAYDVMSLLEDARRDLSPGLKEQLLKRYKQAIGNWDWHHFDRAYAVLGATRHAKVIGIFTRLMVRDAKPQYLQHISRVWRLLEASLAHPDLTPVKTWFDQTIPTDQRRIPDQGPSAS